MTRAVFFDVDFTLIHPGPMFRGEGYRAFGERYGMTLDESMFDAAVASAGLRLELTDASAYDAEIWVTYTRHIVEGMGGSGAAVDACARKIYDEWAACHHFELYEDVAPVVRQLDAEGIRIGLISNSHRSLASFESHFELEGLIAAAVSSSEHGFMKPHPSIFRAALQLVDVPADQAVMVGDSLREDIEGALGAGMRAVLLHRSPTPCAGEHALCARGVPVIATLTELSALL